MIRFIKKKNHLLFSVFSQRYTRKQFKTHLNVPAYLRSLNKLKRQINIVTCCYCDVISCNYTTL